MNVIFKKSTIKDTRFFSFFKPKVLTLTLRNDNISFPIELKAKSTYINCLVPIKENVATRIEIDHKGTVIYTCNINLRKGEYTIQLANTSFKGEIHYEIVKSDSFSILENMKRKKDGKPQILTISRSESIDNNGFERRVDYNGDTYFTQRNLFLTFKNDDINAFEIKNMIDGWRMSKDKNNRVYYIDHYNRTTHSTYPWSAIGMSIIETKKINLLRELYEQRYFHIYSFSRYKIKAKRNFIVQSTAHKLLNYNYKEGLLHVSFLNEIGEDYGGIVREFFYEGSLEIANDKRMINNNGIVDINFEYIINRKEIEPDLFIDTDDMVLLLDRAKSIEDIDPSSALYKIYKFYENNENIKTNLLDDRSFFQYVGIFLALALTFEHNVGVQFSAAFYENLFENPRFDLRKIQDIQMQSQLLKILRMPDREITEEITPKEYVDEICEEYLYSSKKAAYDIILKGFKAHVPKYILKDLSCYELNYILYGRPSISFESFVRSISFINCTAEDKEVQFLFNILRRKDGEYLRKFIMFVTGCGTFPILSLGSNTFFMYFEKTNSDSKMFTAATCIFRLYFSNYATEEEMEHFLDLSVLNTEGFHNA